MEKAVDVLKLFLKNEHQLKEAERVSELFDMWTKLAGINIASHSKIADINRNLIFVQVDHPGWMQVIQLQEEQILRKIQKAFPALEIKGLRMFLSERGADPPPLLQENSDTQQEKEISELGKADSEAVENIQDDEFKQLLKKLGKSIVKKARSKA